MGAIFTNIAEIFAKSGWAQIFFTEGGWKYAVMLAVACVLALGNISDRMEKGLSRQSREFMAGDRALRSSREVPQAWLEEAQKRGLKVGKQLTFATMTFAGDTPQQANVKAVDDIYPMYGDLQTNPPGLKPQAGSVLLAPRLMALLNLKTGDTIDVGDATLRIAGEVIQEPDSGFNPFQMAPRLMMNLADVDKTGAGSPGAINSAATRTSSTAMRNGCYLSLNPNNAGTVWNRTKARWGARWNARNSSCCFRRF